MSQSNERRKHKRIPILETFALSVSIAKKGFYKLPVHDVSEKGIGFDLDLEGEAVESFPVKIGDSLDLRLYLNPSLFLPLPVKVSRIDETRGVRKIGGEFLDQSSENYNAFLAFLNLVDQLSKLLQT